MRILDTPPVHSHNEHSSHADVAELADAQVSEACDGDIVEVQVLSSAPITSLLPSNTSKKIIVTDFRRSVFSLQEVSSERGVFNERRSSSFGGNGQLEAHRHFA